MKLVMSGIDCGSAPIALREKLAFSRQKALDTLAWLSRQPDVAGCVLLSTCNRTELYLTGEAEEPWRLLCQAAGADEDELRAYFTTREADDAALHLMEVACGLHSQILGEDQIITQVRNAIELALEARTTDAALAALFRRAVTAGKRAKTQFPALRGAPSLGTRCCEMLEQELGGLMGKSVVVIGNGQMGRLAATLLHEAGAKVAVTLRSYRHGQTLVPAGCATIPYETRVAALDGVDALVSATTSPHYTITEQQLRSLKLPPKVAIDLAVPRDIEPSCAALMRCYDTDALGTGGETNEDAIRALYAIAQEELEKYQAWQRHRETPARAPKFPLFVSLEGRRVVLIGGGTIAARRIAALRQFGCKIVVIAPELKCAAEGLTWLRRGYESGDLAGAFFAVAATDSREVNHAVYEEAKKRGILVSVADCEAECSFYFPAICTGAELVAGVVSGGKDHHKTAIAAKQIRTVLEELE